MIIKLALLTLVAAIVVYYYQAHKGYRTFNWALMLVFIFFPFAFQYVMTPGIPPFTFYSFTLVPFLFLVLYDERIMLRVTLIDLAVLSFITWAVISGFATTGSKFGILVLMDKMLLNFVPYLLVRVLVYRAGVLQTMYYLAFTITLVAVFAPLEYLFNIKVPQPLQLIWPDYSLWYAFKRGGFNRVWGTFGHPIHAGIMYSIAMYIGFLLLRMKVIQNRKIPWAIFLINGMAMYMSVSRASYAMAVPILLLINLAFVKRKIMYAMVLVTIFTLALSVAIPLMQSYAEIDDITKADEGQTSAAYRNELVPSYMPLVLQSPWYGYGFTIPNIGGYDSIDNQYLLMALNYGIPAFILYSTIMVFAFLYGLVCYIRTDNQRDKLVVWTLVCLIVYLAVMAGSVWFGNQVRTMLYIISGLIAVLAVSPRPDRRPRISFQRTF